MAYNAGLPADSSIIAQGPAEIRENFRALKDDRIVDAGLLGGYAASAFLLKAGGVMTGAVGIIAGTAAAPGLYFTGDTNTGLFAPAADTLALATAGAERLRINSAGRILIGTTTDDGTNLLQITGNAKITGNLQVTGTLTGTASGNLPLTGGTISGNLTVTGTLTGTASGNLPLTGGLMTGAIGIISGTAAAPGLYFSGDTNTGVFAPAADTLALSTGGTERLRVNSAGRVLIGTTTDDGTSNLQIFGVTSLSRSGDGPCLIFNSPSNTYRNIEWQEEGLIKGRLRYLNASAGDASDMLEILVGGATSLVVKSSALLIGTTTDDGANILQVTGNAKITGNLEATGKTVISAGTAAAPGLYFSGDTNTGVFAPAADTLALSTGGTERLRITSAGRILIGTTTDDGTNLLQVNGFTKLGDAATGIKMKIVTGTTPTTAGGAVHISHGLTSSKIVSFTAVVTNNAGAVVPSGAPFSTAFPIMPIESSYFVYANSGSFVVATPNSSGECSRILNRTITIMVWYIA